MSETELLDLQIRIARLTLRKKIDQYHRATQNGSENLRRKYLREFWSAKLHLCTLQNKRSQIGGITPWEENA